MSHQVKSLLLATALAVSFMVPVSKASELELGMTPSHVFGLWTNINACLLAVAGLHAQDTAWQGQLSAMTPQKFEDKKPSDVLDRVAEFRSKLDRLREAAGLDLTKKLDSGDGQVTPSVVFLNSGHVLNGLVDWSIRNSGPDFLVSRFYDRHAFDDKTPSDVFGLVDMANRRIDSILTKRGG